MNVHPHRFRRTFANWTLKGGMDGHYLRWLLGHSSMDMVARYLAPTRQDLEQSHAQASPIDNWL